MQFLDKFEHKFVAQGDYESRDIFGSLDLAWSLLRTFPRESLKRINIKTLDEFCTCFGHSWVFCFVVVSRSQSYLPPLDNRGAQAAAAAAAAAKPAAKAEAKP